MQRTCVSTWYRDILLLHLKFCIYDFTFFWASPKILMLGSEARACFTPESVWRNSGGFQLGLVCFTQSADLQFFDVELFLGFLFHTKEFWLNKFAYSVRRFSAAP